MRYNKKEREALAYRLLEGETRHEFERDGATIFWSLFPSKGKALGTVILLHGVASNASRWEEFCDTSSLHSEWNIIRTDLRGHASSVCSKKVRLEDWVADVDMILEKAGVEKAVVIGHSLGAQIAMNFAVTHPERMAGLILLDPLVSDALTPKAMEMRAKCKYLKVGECVTRAMNAIGFKRKIVPQDLRAMDAEARKMIEKGGDDLEAFIKQYSSASTDLKYIHLAPYLRDLQEVGRPTPDAAGFKCPVLVVGSSAGTFTDEKAMAAWCARLSDATMSAVKCAHWPMTECPQDVAKVIIEWMDVRYR